MRNKKLIILFSVLLGITLLVVFNSVLFSVQHVNAYCANMRESQYEERILDSHKIRKNANIFFVNKRKVTENIESRVPGVKVLNVEKKFPNRIYINFVEVKEYVKAYYNGKTYYCSNDMRVMRIEDGVDNSGNAINLKFGGSLPELKPGDYFSIVPSNPPTVMSDASIITEIFSALEQVGFYDTVIDLFDEIDVTGNFIELRTSNGMKWQIQTPDDLTYKLRLALSVYFSDKLTDLQKRSGTLIIAGKKVFYRGPEGGVAPID